MENHEGQIRSDVDGYLDFFLACGGTDVPYLRLHFPRYLATRARFLSHWQGPTRGALLDVGAHWLHQSVLYAQQGFDVTAVDVPTTFEDDRVRKLADRHHVRLLSQTNPETADALCSLPDATFDVVLLTEIIEHITFNPVNMWREIYRVMKSGAHLIVTTPNYYALRGRVWHWLRFLSGLGSGVDVEHLLLEPSFAHHWKEYSLEELRGYFRILSLDFRIVDAAHVEKYSTSARHGFAEALARQMERAIPFLRPNLYMHFRLEKERGIRLEPRWQL